MVPTPQLQNYHSKSNIRLHTVKCGFSQTLIFDKNNGLFVIKNKKLQQLQFNIQKVRRIHSQQFNTVLSEDGEIFVQGVVQGLDVKEFTGIKKVIKGFRNIERVEDLDIKDDYWVLKDREYVYICRQNQIVQRYDWKCDQIVAGYQFMYSYHVEHIQQQETFHNSTINQQSILNDTSINRQNGVVQDTHNHWTMRSFTKDKDFQLLFSRFQSPKSISVRENTKTSQRSRSPSKNSRIKENNQRIKNMNLELIDEKVNDLQNYIQNQKRQYRHLQQKFEDLENNAQHEISRQSNVISQSVNQYKKIIEGLEKENKELRMENEKVKNSYEQLSLICEQKQMEYEQQIMEIRKEIQKEQDTKNSIEQQLYDFDRILVEYKEKCHDLQKQLDLKNDKVISCLELIKEIEVKFSDQQNIEKIFLNTKYSINDEVNQLSNTSNHAVSKFNEESDFRQKRCVLKQFYTGKSIEKQLISQEIDPSILDINNITKHNILEENF